MCCQWPAAARLCCMPLTLGMRNVHSAMCIRAVTMRCVSVVCADAALRGRPAPVPLLEAVGAGVRTCGAA